ncbi:cyclophilin-like fold protein [Myroides odoratimimus]|uniref:cyclophilin-like fold protein n=1 Tax=Myroides odoratimimus TaxID=76832 RepID=UPI000469FCE0|nr:cyclophilin-like fold protein [Myroides odoratimimus]
MKKLVYILLFVSTCLQSYACTSKVSGNRTNDKVPTDTIRNIKDMKIKIIVGDKMLTATMIDNVTTRAFMELLPFTIDMTELHNNEKYCHLPNKLLGKAVRPGTIQAGDLMLWDADYKCLVLFYKTFSSPYSYVKLGTMDNLEILEATLGSGDVTVKFEELK